jgi:hypothetical protein
MKPNTVVTIQYFRTLLAKLARPSAMCGRVSRLTPSRSGMLAASKARKMTTVPIRRSRDTPPLVRGPWRPGSNPVRHRAVLLVEWVFS